MRVSVVLAFVLGALVAVAIGLVLMLRVAILRVHELEVELEAHRAASAQGPHFRPLAEVSARVDWLEGGQQILARFLVNRLYPGRIRSPRAR